MSVSEADLELLEAHLDGELSPAEEAALRGRLSSDHDLVLELSAIRADREARVELFESFAPDDLAVANLVLSVRKQITKDALWGDRLRILRYIGSAAAVILFSFTAGWLGKGHVAFQDPAMQHYQSVAQRENAGSIDFPGDAQGDQGIGTLVSDTHLAQSTPHVPAGYQGGYQVNLTDAFGHVVAVQHFKTLDEAREFSNDVAQWQRQQQQLRGAEPVDYKGQF